MTIPKPARERDWLDAKPPESLEEIKKRNYPGRVIKLNQFHIRQIQLDLEWLLKSYEELLWRMENLEK